jgi:hypothetical protein
MTMEMNRAGRWWARRVYGIAAGTAMLGFIALTVSLFAPGTTTPATAAKAGRPGATAGTSSTSNLTGRVTGVSLSGTTPAQFGAPVGLSAATATAGANETLSPNADVKPSNWSIQLTKPAPSGGLVVNLEYRKDGVSGSGPMLPSIHCHVPDGMTTCTADTTLQSIQANTPIFVLIGLTQSDSYTGEMLFGYQLSG